MSRLELFTPSKDQLKVESLYKNLEQRIVASPPGICPVDITRAFIEMCHAQTCGKCVPCRVGLHQLKHMITNVLNGDADYEILDLIEETSLSIMQTADCAIGSEAAKMVWRMVHTCRDDFEAHIRNKRCSCAISQPVPCVALCPAHVDIPGYIALVREGRYADAIQLIRKDNPFPSTCGFICEHPCEARCRRNMVDTSVNIRGLKRAAADLAGKVAPPPCGPSTGKKIAVVGGGPSGLSSAYYLQLMGHQVTVYEMLPKLGGMLRYGIPNYRLPKDRLEEDTDAILETGIQVHYNVKIGEDIKLDELRKVYDAVLITVGASTDKKLGLPNEDAEGITSAVGFLRFGIGVESYTVGSAEFALSYAATRNILPLMDNGHYHPTEVVSDKIPALLAFFPEIALHVTRPVRWDSDHVVLFDDETREIAKEIVRNGATKRVYIALDYFDASINRISAWATGARNMQKALLYALLSPNAELKALQDAGNYTKLMVLQEEVKTLPFGDIWREYCLRQGVKACDWFEEVEAYEKKVLANRK